MMQSNTEPNSAESISTGLPTALNSTQFVTNSSVSQIYNVPPPMYFPSYYNYTENCSSASQCTNVFVPPFPPPTFQSNSPHSLSCNNMFPYKQHGSIKTSQFELPFGYNSEGDLCSNVHQNVNDLKEGEFQKDSVSSDIFWIQSWLSKNLNRGQNVHPKQSDKISEAKMNFKKCFELIQRLETMKEEMQISYEDMNIKAWKSICCNVLEVKNEISVAISNFPNILRLQKSVEQRRTKRESQWRRNDRRKKMKSNERDNRQMLHHKIDLWIQLMQRSIDCNKREESLKKEADSVLSAVLRKKAEGRRQLALVDALLKLRQLRVKSNRNQGQHISAEDGIRFEKVAENLKILWEKQLREYNVEEQGMRVMLSEAVDERDQSQVSHERQILSQWDKLLFGSKSCDFPEFYLAAEKNVDLFINIRQSWDKFIVTNKASMQSNIPVGWVLPSNPSSPEWESLLSSEKQKLELWNNAYQ